MSAWEAEYATQKAKLSGSLSKRTVVGESFDMPVICARLVSQNLAQRRKEWRKYHIIEFQMVESTRKSVKIVRVYARKSDRIVV